MKKFNSRKAFVQSLGATCDNWGWSWSFVNHEKRQIIFGAFDKWTTPESALILSEDWRTKPDGSGNPGYGQSIRHVDLIAEAGYTLWTFPLKHAYAGGTAHSGKAKIDGFKPTLTQRRLLHEGRHWYGVTTELDIAYPETEVGEMSFAEGATKSVVVSAIERSRKARQACIAHHGVNCAVCGMNFLTVYGELGLGYIHIHHLQPIGQSKGVHTVDPLDDLVPVCPNCHAIIHKRNPPYSVEDIKMRLQRESSH